jgi:hypothetical protein
LPLRNLKKLLQTPARRIRWRFFHGILTLH